MPSASEARISIGQLARKAHSSTREYVSCVYAGWPEKVRTRHFVYYKPCIAYQHQKIVRRVVKNYSIPLTLRASTRRYTLPSVLTLRAMSL